jgi:biopolymer transport protein ExbD
MRRPPYHRDDRGRLDVKMTPMIDVIFLLLIFFVCTASFRPAEEILPTNLSLPGTVSDVEPVNPEWEDLDEIIVKILWHEGRPGWRMELRGQQADPRACRDLKELGEALAAVARVRADLPVILDVEDKDHVPIESVIDVWDLCRRIGLEKVQLAASVDA